MKKFGLIGENLNGSYSKIMHQYIYEEYGIKAEYNNYEIQKIKQSSIKKLIKKNNLNGVNITVPYKNKIMKFCDGINNKAEIINAVNCISIYNNKMYGYNTDYYGFLMLLKINNIKIEGTSFYVLGAGGSAHSIIYSLIQAGSSKITVINRTTNKLSKIKKHFKNSMNYDIQINNYNNFSLSDNACIVNCTPLGTGILIDKSPIKKNTIQPKHILIDINYNPLKTKFLIHGEKAGVKSVNGLDMLIYQALTSIDIWLEKNISSNIDFKKIKRLLIKEYVK